MQENIEPNFAIDFLDLLSNNEKKGLDDIMKQVDKLENPTENAVVPVDTPPVLQNPAEIHHPVFAPVYNTHWNQDTHLQCGTSQDQKSPWTTIITMLDPPLPQE